MRVCNTPRSGDSQQGFTRLDFLAVCACVMVLAGMQLVAAGASRVSAMGEACMNNQRRLILAWQMYAADWSSRFPPNPEDGNTTPTHNWVPGQAGSGASHEFNPDVLAAPTRSLLYPYLNNDVTVFRCPSDLRRGRYTGTDFTRRGVSVPAARSVSMNGAVGTDPYVVVGSGGARNVLPVHGPWLDNVGGHTRDGPWRTYGREGHLVDPGPARTIVLLDEHQQWLYDGHFGFGMAEAQWVDYPATRHDGAGSIAFADGHVEMHRWLDPLTRAPFPQAARPAPGSPDHAWLRERISAAKNP